MNHKWDKDDVCIRCKTYREKRSVKTRMAIHNGRDVYKYEVKYIYIDVHLKETFDRPTCWVTTYDN